MERSSQMNASNNALLALVRSTVLIAQNKGKVSSEQRALEEQNPSGKKLNVFAKDISEVSLEVDSSMPGNDSTLKSSALKRLKGDVPDASNSAVVAVVKRRRTYVNHSYTDFSKLAPDLQYSEKTNLEDMTFTERIHHVLSKKEFQSYIAWKSHGRAFCILVPKVFEKQVCAEYFAMPPRYSTFLRQLNNHGFKQISQGPDRNCYYHECFLRGMPWLCKYMPQPKNARLLMPDPENEPDFYTLSKLFPLPDHAYAQDKNMPPSAPKKHYSTTEWSQSPPSSTMDTTNFVFAQAAPYVAGQPKAALKRPITSTAALVAPYNAAIMPQPNVSLTSALHLDQLRLMQASVLKEEQDVIYKNALQRAVLQGGFARNNGHFISGLRF